MRTIYALFALFALLLALLTAQPVSAQPVSHLQQPIVPKLDFSFSPVFLFTKGSGRIVTFFNQQQKQRVGLSSLMIAIPAPGYKFSGWQRVNVFVLNQYLPGGSTPISSVNKSAIPTVYPNLFEIFTVQRGKLIAVGQNTALSVYSGWQANFTPLKTRR